MIVDKNPIIDSSNKTFRVEYNIEVGSVSILMNGIIILYDNDVNIIDNIIELKDDSGIDWVYDEFVILYDKLI